MLKRLQLIGPGLFIEAARSLLTGGQRSLAEDSARIVGRMNPQPRVEAADLIPARDPFLLVANHYQVPGWWVGWAAVAITDAVARARAPGCRELHWLILSEWRWFELGGHWVASPATPLLFPRACRVWSQIPMSQRASEVAGRARALRQALSFLGHRQAGDRTVEPVGIFPEGRATVALREAMPGSGSFLHRVSGLGVPLLPVGIYRQQGGLVVRFGAPFFVGNPPPGEGDLDRWASRRVMVAIGGLLPPSLWGASAREIEDASSP